MVSFKEFLESKNGITGSLVKDKQTPNHRKINAYTKINHGIGAKYLQTGHHKSDHPKIQRLQNTHGSSAVALTAQDIQALKLVYPRLARLQPGKSVSITSNSPIKIQIDPSGHGRAIKHV